MTGDRDAAKEGDNWLDGRAIVCVSCVRSLWRVVRSPFYDSWLLYCDQCPKRAEVSYYDNEVTAIQHALATGGDSVPLQSARMYREIERRLAPCDCGGRFRLSADRRCHGCHAVVLVGSDADGIDLWPHWSGADFGDPTPEEEKEWGEFESAFIRSDGLWQPREP